MNMPSPESRRAWWLALAGAVTMFLVQPPFDLWLLAWVAPLPWLLLIRQGMGNSAHPWRMLWCAGFLHWLLSIHWLRLPHPATSIGWVALSAYLAIYTPLFFWTTQRLMGRWRWPLVAAAPICWMGLEHARGSILGGFTLGALGHTQWRFTTLIQCADCLGAEGVGGVVMLVAAALATLLAGRGTVSAHTASVAAFPPPSSGGPSKGSQRREQSVGLAAAGGVLRLVVPGGVLRLVVPGGVLRLVVAGGVLGLALLYGSWRLAEAPGPVGQPLQVLLVQGSIDTELKHDPAAAGEVLRHYDDLTTAALEQGGRPDLIVWPETMWRYGLLEIAPEEVLPAEIVEQSLGPAEAGDDESSRQARCRRALMQERLDLLATYARRYGTHWLVGLDRQVVSPSVPGGMQNFNTALFLDPVGRPLGRYDKMFPVMFGEYVPLAEQYPWLYRLTPLPGGLSAGKTPVAERVAGYWLAPTICYETTLPGAVREVVRELQKRGTRPDVLVNLTNDGWFWGSSELDMHLASAIFRAVEVRTPLVIAANTGLSASIDGSGRLLARGPRRATATLSVQVSPDGRQSPWLSWGSVPTGGCLAIVLGLLAEGIGGRLRARRRVSAPVQ